MVSRAASINREAKEAGEKGGEACPGCMRTCHTPSPAPGFRQRGNRSDRTCELSPLKLKSKKKPRPYRTHECQKDCEVVSLTFRDGGALMAEGGGRLWEGPSPCDFYLELSPPSHRLHMTSRGGKVPNQRLAQKLTNGKLPGQRTHKTWVKEP